MEWKVARVAGFHEGGGTRPPAPLQAMPHQCLAQSGPLRGRRDADQVQEPAGLVRQVSA